jgi:hypothetical protein
MYSKAVLVACATTLALTGTALSATTSAVPPSWLGDVPGFGQVAPDATTPGVPISLAGCTVSLDAFKDDPARVRPFVPAHYELGTLPYFGPGSATIGALALVCDAARVDGGSPARTVLSMIVVHILPDRSNREGGDPIWEGYNRWGLNLNLASSTWYLIAAGTDNAAVARRLGAAGLPIEDLPDLAYRNDYSTAMKTDFLRVPSRTSGYELATTTVVADCCFYHNHDMAVLYDGPTGTVGLVNHLYAMIDSACGYWASAVVHAAVPDCVGRLTAPPGSRIADFLGGTSRETTWAFNHPKAHQPGYLSIIEPSKQR